MRWAVLVGGTGSNLRAILASGLPVHLVISNRMGVGALDIAREYGLEAVVITAKAFPDRARYDQELARTLGAHRIDAVAMAGFLRWLQPQTIQAYRGRILNLHPSLLPAYPGLHAIERAFSDGVLWTGVSVHFVDEGHDTGPLVAQAPVPRLPGDSLADLEARIHATEHRLYPRVLHAVDEGSAWLQDDGVHYKEEQPPWIHGHF
ncbi:phosphoribosylglycinamide formyltransferase [Sulfobacillus harzensis]|uniref:Phosphoribosylglycinamide formyltransferase n=1 Tax=Sulfobacillus harzensis TaxID=2729629 RepID=A0A7Y0Q2K2_9FIRM|nr:phosphoribosylglycinamide formyltransferase [Sulfobacillus harzensis]NMP22607.1 phosphoribosylglycinamide formyltransferase [Sulfobacillus harzensis]